MTNEHLREAPKLLDSLSRHPWTVHWAALMANGRAVVHSAVDAIGERNAWAINLITAGLTPAAQRRYKFSMASEEVPEAMAVDCGTNMVNATPYLWRSDIRQIAQSYPLPRHIVDTSVVPFYPPMFWTWENRTHTGRGDEWSNDWFALHRYSLEDGRTSIRFWYNESNDATGELVLGFGDIPDGAMWPDDFPGHQDGVDTVILKLLAFLASPFVAQDKISPSRQERRRAQRDSEHEIPEVSVITLRGEAAQSHADSRREGEGGTELTHRFWVRGHIRAQWYPSVQRHQLIWIAPYIKGPDGTTLVERAYDVAR